MTIQHPLPRSLRRSPLDMAADIRALVARWSARSRQRRALAELDSHLLRDVGLDALQAAHECRKPFWR